MLVPGEADEPRRDCCYSYWPNLPLWGGLGQFKPVDIVVSDEVSEPYLEDGNHRLKVARN